ncbi:hypothetical protein [Synechococcus sp. PCC 7335]|uniref:hypothetical protein n=1 Tax=Synechococcus sp. (strain ATCC 29403 / PCC 7335) TaxID=91464 RepID=UPI001D0D3E36|nr:hypothetical protein [Synechococcus sp. PCC 7335]
MAKTSEIGFSELGFSELGFSERLVDGLIGEQLESAITTKTPAAKRAAEEDELIHISKK